MEHGTFIGTFPGTQNEEHSLEHGTWNLKLGTWNMENGIWNNPFNMENSMGRRTRNIPWNMEPELGTRDLEPGT